jgi:uncharacterized membrane protein YkgB
MQYISFTFAIISQKVTNNVVRNDILQLVLSFALPCIQISLLKCVQKTPTNAHKFFLNSLFLKYSYTYFGGLNHHLEGVVEIKLHRLIVITYMVIFIYVEYEWASIAHFVQYVKLCKINIK